MQISEKKLLNTSNEKNNKDVNLTRINEHTTYTLYNMYLHLFYRTIQMYKISINIHE